MIKKVLFYGVAIIMGLMLVMTSYYGFYMTHIQHLIQDNIDSKNYDLVSKAFLPFYNEDEFVFGGNDKYAPVHVYEAMVGEKTEITINGEKSTTNRYERAYVFYLDDITFDVDGIETNGQYINHTKLRLYNDGEYFDYYFNEPNTIKEDKHKDSIRHFVTAAKQLGFVELDITESIVKNDKLKGAIDAFEVYNGKNELVGQKVTLEKELDFNSPFFELGLEVENAYDAYLKDSQNQEVAKTYSDFYKGWYERYTANENYGIAYTQKELKPMSVYLKTGGVLIAYVALMSVLGYFLLRNGNSNKKIRVPMEKKTATKPNPYEATPRIDQLINEPETVEEVTETAEVKETVLENVEESTEIKEEKKETSTEIEEKEE